MMKGLSADADDNHKDATRKLMEYYKDAKASRNGHGFLNFESEKDFGNGRIQRNFDGYYYDVPEDHPNHISKADKEDIKKEQEKIEP